MADDAATLPTISVVINTLDRARELEHTLEALRWQRYRGRFEVVVVNGPSSDDTEAVLSRWDGRVVVGTVAEPNLSVSRNEGIRLASGDIVAFLDDDAIPEPRWLTELAQAYDDASVGAVGGFVLDHTGHEYQYTYGSIDRFGFAEEGLPASRTSWCFPGSWRIPHLMGTNASYRRSALVEVGGYDEFYEYFLDESDLQIRLVDAGYVIVQTPRARVHHHFAPSGVRNAARVPKDRYPILKNKLYFALRHAREYTSTEAILQMFHAYVDQHRADVRWHVERGALVEADIARLEVDVDRAIEAGLRGGFDEHVRWCDVSRQRDAVLAFETLPNPEPRRIVLVTNEYPPDRFGGIGTFTHDLATGLAQRGHAVHVLTTAEQFDRVDWEDGVWVHRLVSDVPGAEADTRRGEVPAHLWAWSAACVRELDWVAEIGPIDVVEAPIWDAQGIAVLRDGRYPLVVSLQTTMATWLESHPAQRGDAAWMAAFGERVLAAERELLEGAQAVKAISHAIGRDVESSYGVKLGEKAVVAPLGIGERRAPLPGGHSARVTRTEGAINVLFVGRLEERKGVDVLLRAFAAAHAEEPSLRLFLAGDDSVPWGDTGVAFRDLPEVRATLAALGAAVHVLGVVSEAQLGLAYENADVFVAPSRYESFGLVFVEAMQRGLAVIGTAVGGVPEVVRDGVDGTLVPPDDPAGLAAAIIGMVREPAARVAMGRAGRERYEAEFTRDAMVGRAERMYASVVGGTATR